MLAYAALPCVWDTWHFGLYKELFAPEHAEVHLHESPSGVCVCVDTHVPVKWSAQTGSLRRLLKLRDLQVSWPRTPIKSQIKTSNRNANMCDPHVLVEVK